MPTEIYDICQVQYGYFTNPFCELNQESDLLSNGSHNSQTPLKPLPILFNHLLLLIITFYMLNLLLFLVYCYQLCIFDDLKVSKTEKIEKEKKRMMHLGTSRTSVQCIMGNMVPNSGFRGVVSQMVFLFLCENRRE